MILKRTLIQTASLILWASSLVAAQALTEPVIPRFYGGVGVLVGNYRIAYNSGSYHQGIFDPVLTAGYQLTRKLSVQVSWANGKDASHLEGQAYEPPLQPGGPSRPNGYYFLKYNYKMTSVPVLFRYTGTNRLERRIQFDVLGGLTLLRASYNLRSRRVDSLNEMVSDVRKTQQATQVALTLGLGVRIRLIKNLELVGDAQGNRTLVNRGYGKNQFVPTYLVGLRYRFHER